MTEREPHLDAAIEMLMADDPWFEDRTDDIFLNDESGPYWDEFEYEDSYDYEAERKIEEDDRFFERWGYFPDDETPEEAALRAESEEQDQLLRDINYASQEGASSSLGALLYAAFTAK